MNKILILAVVSLSTGCASHQGPISEAYGTAFVANNNAMIVDARPAEGAPKGDGAVIAAAIQRYRTDKVKEPNAGQFKPGDETSGNGK